MEKTDSSQSPMSHFNGNINMFQPDFIHETEFENFISMIRGETVDPIVKFCMNYECDHISGCGANFASENGKLYEDPLFSYEQSTFHDAIGTTGALDNAYNVIDPDSTMIWNPMVDQEKGFVDLDDQDDNSSETATTTNGDAPRKSGAKGDRARTLVSERKRRSRMKEKLYALRSLVPNITKMDKASIVGDAARYVQELQMQAKNLRAEIAKIESISSTNQKGSSQSSKKIHTSNSFPTCKKISKMDIFQVEERGYYVRLVCNRGQGVAVSLLKALESITSFEVQSSNLGAIGENFVLTFTLNVMGYEVDINLPNLKLWVAGAFLNQGFDFGTYLSA